MPCRPNGTGTQVGECEKNTKGSVSYHFRIERIALTAAMPSKTKIAMFWYKACIFIILVFSSVSLFLTIADAVEHGARLQNNSFFSPIIFGMNTVVGNQNFLDDSCATTRIHELFNRRKLDVFERRLWWIVTSQTRDQKGIQNASHSRQTKKKNKKDFSGFVHNENDNYLCASNRNEPRRDR